VFDEDSDFRDLVIASQEIEIESVTQEQAA
jgi:hypothetical protein